MESKKIDANDDDQDDEPLVQHRPCPFGIPADVLRNMSEEDRHAWDWGEIPAPKPGQEQDLPRS